MLDVLWTEEVSAVGLVEWPRSLRGRWLGRKDATAAGSRGLSSDEARRVLAERAKDLHGATLTAYWRGVSEIRPEWSERD